MDDIIATQPWTDGSGWHQRSFWVYSGGTYTVDEYTDGDHEDCDESDIPSADEIDAAWREYSQHVAQTGEDPLHEYLVRRERKLREVWGFQFNTSIVGPVLLAARRGRTVVPAAEIPDHVRAFLGLRDDSRRLGCAETWAEFAELVPGVKPRVWLRQEIEHKVPRAPKTVTRELRAVARRWLKGAAA